MKTDRWYFQVFQSAPDLIRALLPGGRTPTELGLDPSGPGDRVYRLVVITPHSRLRLGPTLPLQVFLKEQVAWLSLEELSQRPRLDPLLNLLTLPVRPDIEVGPISRQILNRRPDLNFVVVPMMMERYPQLSKEEILVIAGIPLDQIRHTRAAREFLEEGRQQGKIQEAVMMTLRQLNRRCGPLNPTTTTRIEALPLEQRG